MDKKKLMDDPICRTVERLRLMSKVWWTTDDDAMKIEGNHDDDDMILALNTPENTNDAHSIWELKLKWMNLEKRNGALANDHHKKNLRYAAVYRWFFGE